MDDARGFFDVYGSLTRIGGRRITGEADSPDNADTWTEPLLKLRRLIDAEAFLIGEPGTLPINRARARVISSWLGRAEDPDGPREAGFWVELRLAQSCRTCWPGIAIGFAGHWHRAIVVAGDRKYMFTVDEVRGRDGARSAVWDEKTGAFEVPGLPERSSARTSMRQAP